MKTILEKFAHGNISPEPRYFKQNSLYGKAMQALSEKEEKLSSTLSETQKALLKEFTDIQMELNSITGADKFVYGYKLGVLMTTEVFLGKDDLVVGSEG